MFHKRCDLRVHDTKEEVKKNKSTVFLTILEYTLVNTLHEDVLNLILLILRLLEHQNFFRQTRDSKKQW